MNDNLFGVTLTVRRKPAPVQHETTTLVLPPGLTKHMLMEAFFKRGCARVMVKGYTGTLDSIQREDGSGSSFNLKLVGDSGVTISVHVRTVD